MKLNKIVAAAALSLISMGANAITLDQVAGSTQWKLSGLTTESNTWAGTNETTWGVGAVTQLTSATGTWFAGASDGYYLYYMIYGISDLNIVSNNGANFDIYNIGATGGVADGEIHMDIYRTTTQIPAIDQFFNADPADRTAFDMYSAFAALGPAYLEVVMGAGKQTVDVTGSVVDLDPLADETMATLVQHTFSQSLPTSGQGEFFADVVGGTAAAKWDTNGQFGHDFDAKYTLSVNGDTFGTGTCTDAQIASNDCFAGYINDPIRSKALPEPGTLALVGLALTGLAISRRRKA